ncbi:leucine-rich repeat domain-containing protein [Wenyingzhuangia sp. IMCC45533]
MKQAVDLSSFRQLRVVNLSNIYDVETIKQTLLSVENPENIEVIILNNNNLNQIPKEIVRFKKLSQLSLNGNPALNFSSAFKLIGRLPKLEFLDCQYNQLRKIPKEIVFIKSLKELNLSNNRLEFINDFTYLSELPKLRSLWMRNNHLKRVSKNLNGLSQLVNLYMENNLLTELPVELSGLKSLRVLHLSFNNFKELPLTLQTLPNLILLHIDHCKITSISNTFTTKSVSIKGLVINDNLLSKNDILKWKAKFQSFFLLIF